MGGSATKRDSEPGKTVSAGDEPEAVHGHPDPERTEHMQSKSMQSDRPDSSYKAVADSAEARRPPGSEGRTQRNEWLSRGLRRLYDDTVRDPIPDTFRQLLDELDRSNDGAATPREGNDSG